MKFENILTKILAHCCSHRYHRVWAQILRRFATKLWVETWPFLPPNDQVLFRFA